MNKSSEIIRYPLSQDRAVKLATRGIVVFPTEDYDDLPDNSKSFFLLKIKNVEQFVRKIGAVTRKIVNEEDFSFNLPLRTLSRSIVIKNFSLLPKPEEYLISFGVYREDGDGKYVIPMHGGINLTKSELRKLLSVLDKLYIQYFNSSHLIKMQNNLSREIEALDVYKFNPQKMIQREMENTMNEFINFKSEKVVNTTPALFYYFALEQGIAILHCYLKFSHLLRRREDHSLFYLE